MREQADVPRVSRVLPGWFLPVYAGWIALLTAAYFTAVITRVEVCIPILWGLIGCSGIGAMIFGVYWNRPANKGPWIFLIAGMTAFITGDCYFKVSHYIRHIEDPFPSFADVLYMAMFALVAIGISLIIRRRSPKGSNYGLGSVLDALTVSVSLLMFLWVYLIQPQVDLGGPLLPLLVSVAYPLGDALVWSLLAWLLMTDYKTTTVRLLAIGAAGLIVADVVYSLGQFYGFWHEGNPMDLGWVVFYGFWGAAALHYSMAGLSTPNESVARPVRAKQLILLSFAALTAPVILYDQFLRGTAERVSGGIAVFAAILFVLVMLRMFTLTREITRHEADSRLNQEKDELLAISSHQLRTPLTAIQLYTEALSATPLAAEQIVKYVGVIAESNQRMINIVNTLIYTSALDMGEVHFSKEAVSLDEVCTEALAGIGSMIQTKHVAVQNNLIAEHLHVTADKGALVTVLTSVLTNAVQYSIGDTPRITVSATRNQGDTATITIADNGQGIPAADLPKIFSKLYRASNARTMMPDGSGLSLYLARTVLTRMGGTITLESTQGTGTTARITVPAAVAIAAPATPAA